MEEDAKREKGDPENQYFKLIQVVGSKGKYQTFIIILTSVLCFQNGFASLGTPYYFAVSPYTNCPPQYKGITECTKYACSLPPAQRAQYEQPQISQLRTLGNQYGDYHCGSSDLLQTAKGVYYFGGIVGVLVGGPASDNFGRRLTLLVSLVLGLLGHIIVQLAGKLAIVEVGMFFIGISVQSCFNLSVCILSQVLQNTQRQKKTTLVMGFFPVAGIVVVVAFLAFKYWRPIFIIFGLIPMTICMIFSFFFVQQTPQFLIKRYSVQQIRKSLKFIAKINKRIQNFQQSELVSQQSLQLLKKQYKEQIQKSEKKAFTYIDLFRYASLRKLTIFITILFVMVNVMYYAPAMLIDQFGFDFYFNGFIVNFSELLTYLVGFFIIMKVKRKKVNIIGSAVTLICSFILIFLHTKQICTEDCWNARNIFEVLMVFVMRLFVSFLFQVLFIYITELYPTQVIGLAIGFTATIGAMPVMFIPEILNVINRSTFPVMILFCIVAAIYLGSSFFLQETHGRPPTEKIKEIKDSQTAAITQSNGKANMEIQLVEEKDDL